MPIYEYECPACRAVFSELVPMDVEAAPPCPRCGGTAARKRLSRFARGRTESEHQAALAERAAGVDRASRQDIARFFQETGGGTGDDAFREVVDRAAAGATDADMADIVRDVPVRGRDEAQAAHQAAHHTE
jgi:putative FmdB family regulatory protein